ncbi:RDD family protein [Caldibacillus lycopersici]|uniref:RDD family protein n=1 Tax=Perspicuibacillus lycopersici TaxID=1325689 RepID=A0AAE3LR49_9BACI|nr:RDD family protein [Perspicuibacillus lycopersici]MCU9614214.1 RDD family protein [Perspicuibacillus lycopersici]
MDNNKNNESSNPTTPNVPLANEVLTDSMTMKYPDKTATASNLDITVYAGFWMRIWAYIIDLMIIAGLSAIIVKPIATILNWPTSAGIFSLYNIANAMVFYSYFVFMTKGFQQTLGKMIFGLKVIPLKEEKLSWATVIFREWIGRYLSVSIFILYILVAFLPKKQGLHDIFADTTVIHEQYIKKAVI